MPETQAQYKARILGHVAGREPLPLLTAAPAALGALLATVPPGLWARRPAPGKWSIQEIVAHLADDELVGAYRIRLILADPGTAIQAFDQDLWAKTGRYADTDPWRALELFRALREANLALWHRLTPAEWEHAGVHAERGVESIRDIAAYYAGHDLNHFAQIEAILASAGAGPMTGIRLRPVLASDLDTFFEHQRDPVALSVGTLTSRERPEFDAHWARILADRLTILRTVECEGAVAGYVTSFLNHGLREVAYWYGREHWGKGIATEALSQFLAEVGERPLFARVIVNHAASRRVLEKVGFRIEATETTVEPSGVEIQEYLLRLD